MKKFLQNIVILKKISTIKDFRFETFPSISGSGSGYTFYRPPYLPSKTAQDLQRSLDKLCLYGNKRVLELNIKTTKVIIID